VKDTKSTPVTPTDPVTQGTYTLGGANQFPTYFSTPNFNPTFNPAFNNPVRPNLGGNNMFTPYNKFQ
jgi:hypothetical protein